MTTAEPQEPTTNTPPSPLLMRLPHGHWTISISDGRGGIVGKPSTVTGPVDLQIQVAEVAATER